MLLLLLLLSYSGEDASGAKGVRQHILDETDDLWVELRHSFIAEVYSSVSERLRQFQDKNKAAKYKTGQGEGWGMCGTGIYFGKVGVQLDSFQWRSAGEQAVGEGSQLAHLLVARDWHGMWHICCYCLSGAATAAGRNRLSSQLLEQ